VAGLNSTKILKMCGFKIFVEMHVQEKYEELPLLRTLGPT
jgi:hypothetical protein